VTKLHITQGRNSPAKLDEARAVLCEEEGLNGSSRGL
jgi:hypothetical protein